MSKCLLLHDDNDNIVIHGFNWEHKPDGMSDDDYILSKTITHDKHKERFKGKFYKIIDESELPPRDTRDQWMPCEKKIIKIDYNWEEKLMPCWLIGKKEIDKNETLISNELKNDIPDEIFILKLIRENDLIKKHIKFSYQNQDQSLFLYEKSLSNLDARVTGGKSDKPKIREKLQAKIEELKNATKK